MVDALQAAMAAGTNVEEARAVRARNDERRRKKEAKAKRRGGKEKGKRGKTSAAGIPRLIPQPAEARDVAL